MRTQVLLSLLLTFGLITTTAARIVEPWTYQEMFDKADLVVIAGFVSTAETDERTTLLDDIKVVGVATVFKGLLVLKGTKNITTFQLHH